MAKKSSSNAVKKIDEQIKKLTEIDEQISSVETAPVVDKTLLENELKINGPKKPSSATKSNKKSGNRTGGTKKKSNEPVKNAKKMPAKKKIATDKLDNTIKIKKLESEIRSLYNKSDEELGKTKEMPKIVETVSKKAVNAGKGINDKLEDVSESFLNKILLIVFIIFMIFFIMFVGFVIFISTF